MKKSIDPGRIHSSRESSNRNNELDFAENLAYDVNEEFGNNYKIWLGEDRNRNKGAESKVKLKPLTFIRSIHAPQAREACGDLTSEKTPIFPTSLKSWRSAVIVRIVLRS